MNRVTLSGCLRYKPRITYTQTGACRASIFLTVPRCHGDTAEDFIIATAWDDVAEDLRDYANKGDYIEIDGVIRTRTITKERKKYVQEIIAKHVGFPGRKPARNVNE